MHVNELPDLRPADLTDLRAQLTAHRFSERALRALWGPDVDAALSRNDAAPASWFLAAHPSTPLGVLAQLFVLGEHVSLPAVADALGADLVRSLTAARLLVESDAQATSGASDEPHPGFVTATLELRPFDVPQAAVLDGAAPTIFLLADHGTLTSAQPIDEDFVLGLGGAGRTLASITPRQAVDLAVDLGCGCGIQALLLARHAQRVIATDVSTRALRLTELNAQLNDVHTIETRLGSLLDPVPGNVNLLVSNPPFVITPQGQTTAYTYRDGGMGGDALVRSLIENVAQVLAPDGIACMLGNWEYGTDRTRPHTWPPASDASVMVIERDQVDPVTYAQTWVRDGGVVRATPRWNADVSAWLADFDARGVTGVGFGWVWLHRTTSGSAARSFTQAPGALGDNPGGVAQFLATRLGLLEWLAGVSDEELCDTEFVRSSDVTEHRHFNPGEESPSVIVLEQGAGLAHSFTADAALAGFVGVADGSLSLAAVAGALAQLLDVDKDALRGQLLTQVRELVPAGLLYPTAG